MKYMGSENMSYVCDLGLGLWLAKYIPAVSVSDGTRGMCPCD